MKNIRVIILSLFLVGCSPFPIHYACETPKFAPADKSKDASYFDANGYFEKFCPEGVPERFTFIINESTNVIVRVRGEWIDLRPLKNGTPFKLLGNGIRDIDFEGYTQAIRVGALVDGTLNLRASDKVLVNIKFNLVECTCVTYDAI